VAGRGSFFLREDVLLTQVWSEINEKHGKNERVNFMGLSSLRRTVRFVVAYL
jgi:hypothetical protein